MNLAKFLHDFGTALINFELETDCFSLGQLESKQWLVDEYGNLPAALDLRLGTVYVLCGWYGVLPAMLFLNYENEIDKMRSFDIDPWCMNVADQINKTYSSDNWRFKAVAQDINEINFEEHSWQCWSNKNERMSYPITDKPDTIINTSCEHTDAKWYEKVPEGKTVILQSNSSFGEDGHINAMTSLEEMVYTYPMKTTYYKGEMEFENYKRFMLMGVK